MRMKAIERRVLQSGTRLSLRLIRHLAEMGLCLGAALRLRSGQALQTEFLERTPEKKASAEPSTKHDIEPVRLRASLFQARFSINRVSWLLLQP
jgi:hypothetical protein